MRGYHSALSFAPFQVEAYTNEEANRQMPSYGLPYKILCRVVNVQLKVFLFLSIDALVSLSFFHYYKIQSSVVGGMVFLSIVLVLLIFLFWCIWFSNIIL